MTSLRRRPLRRLPLGLLALGLFLLSLPGAPAQQPPKEKASAPNLPADWVKALHWRGIGPANMSGRITALAVYEADPSIYYVASASGGLLKTTNNGVTFQHQFDKESTVSIGDVCVAPSNANIVWVGTGEANPRNSVSYGDGVYRSLDGGRTWRNMGLKKTYQIGRIAIHPKNPDIVYVGALGRLYGPSNDRGLYKTTDGGKNWKRILYADENTGVIDVKMHPSDPDTLLVALWERRRDGFDSHIGEAPPDGLDVYDPVVRWGKASGIYKTTDGGKTFNRMTRGLPTNPLGRIGLDYYRKDPRVVFAVVDCQKIGMGPPPKVVAAGGYLGIQAEDGEPGPGARLTIVTPNGPAEKAGLQPGDLIQALGTAKIMDYGDLLDETEKYAPGDKVKCTFRRDQQQRQLDLTFGKRPGKFIGGGGGLKGPKKGRPYHAYYGGQKENLQNQQGVDSFEYGGIYKSTDGGESWARVNSLNSRPMYFSEVRVDPTDERRVYAAGVSLHYSSNGGRTFRSGGGGQRGAHPDHHALWIDPRDGRHMILGCDGGFYATYDRMKNWDHINTAALGQFYHVAVDSKKPYWVYGGLQDNGSWGGPSQGLRGVGPVNEDWLAVGGGDGFVCRIDPTDPDLVYFETQNGNMVRRHLKTGERAPIRPANAKGIRFNWNTPFLLSHHNPRIFYAAGNYVFRSIKRGADLRAISPDITRTRRGSATALAESPKNPDVLWVGTDDGALSVTRDGGRTWNNVAAKVGLPGPRWVATIEASRFAEGRAYVAFDAHRSDDDRPNIYVTEDYGQTWKSLQANLPTFGSTRCLREDVTNADLLYLGTEFSVYASLNRGESWVRVNNNLPTVAVHEIAVHPTAGEIVAATHGRSLWILDVSALRQMTPKALAAKVALYRPHDTVRWRLEPAAGRTNRRFVGENPQPGAQLYYSLKEKANQASIRILDINGKVMKELKAPTTAGLHRVAWDLTGPRVGGGGKGKGKGKGKGGPGGFGLRAFVAPGDYRAVLLVDGEEFGAGFRVEADPNAPPSGLAEDEGDGREPRPRDH